MGMRYKNPCRKYGDMAPVLLVYTRVPGGVGKSQNVDKDKGRENVEHGKENAN